MISFRPHGPLKVTGRQIMTKRGQLSKIHLEVWVIPHHFSHFLGICTPSTSNFIYSYIHCTTDLENNSGQIKSNLDSENWRYNFFYYGLFYSFTEQSKNIFCNFKRNIASKKFKTSIIHYFLLQNPNMTIKRLKNKNKLL